MERLPQPPRPRFDPVWGVGISLAGSLASGLAGASGLSLVFALLAGLFASSLLLRWILERWRRIRPQARFPRSRLDFLFLLALAGYLLAVLLEARSWRTPLGLLLGFLGAVYLGRWLAKLRARMLWRLRNRLLVTYLFISLIPIFLILGMVGLTAYMVYGQLAGYLISTDLESKAAQLGTASLAMSAEIASLRAGLSPSVDELSRLLERKQARLRTEFPELSLSLAFGRRTVMMPPGAVAPPCHPLPVWVGDSFRAVVAFEKQLFLHSAVAVSGMPGATLCLSVPVNETVLSPVAASLGNFTLTLLENIERLGRGTGIKLVIGDRTYVSAAQWETSGPGLSSSRSVFDPVLNGASKFNVVRWDPDSPEPEELPVLISISTRPSLLNQRIFAPLGEVGQAFLAVLFVIGIVFLLLQVVSLVTGVRLTRSITTAIHDLYAATQRLERGDFSARIPHRRDDQLGTLGDSFNQMAASIERLIEESKERQRLEQELEIARQVQEELFPRQLPILRTLRLAGHCRPARRVSGDYYDYGLAEPGKLVFTIGDISGKGISAALLMASIQSILRSHLYASRLLGTLEQLSVAKLVARLNRQLCATTSPEKYSTLFVGFYDDSTRRLLYTNAGHLPPLLVRGDQVQALGVGGSVVGLFPDSDYEQETVELQPGDWLVAYTDGITEAENSYGEEYGSERLLRFLQRTVDSLSPESVIDAVLAELQQWSPGMEPSDDCTLLVARAE